MFLQLHEQEHKRDSKVEGQWRSLGSRQAAQPWISISNGTTYRKSLCTTLILLKPSSEASFLKQDLLDVNYLSPLNIREWCARNTRRPDFLRAIPRSLFDLVDKCLVVNPRQRISAEEALSHDFFAPCREAIKKLRLRRQGLSNDSETSLLLLHGEAEP